jgi:16S rRNA processing protein RimM
MSEPRSRARVCVAQIGAPHGVRGEVRLRSFTAEPGAVANYGPLEAEDGRRFEIASLRPAKDAFIVRLHGFDDRDSAAALRNLRLYVPRNRLAEPEADEFYHADIVGLEAVDADGTSLGTVTGVHNFGAGDLIEVQRPDERAGVLLPFTKAVVPEIDLAAGRLVIDPPKGAFDELDADT